VKRYDAVIVGAGAAGLFCAAQAGQRGVRVLLLDHAEKLAEKIRISGGGRCNFTNRDASPAQFHSENPAFCRSALARYTAQDFITLVQRHRIAFHEKHRGQMFCDDSSQQIIDMLLRECEAGGVERWQPCAVAALRQRPVAAAGAPRWELDTARGPVEARDIVIATGGLPIPKIGATDFGLRIARQAGHAIVEPRPALVPLTFDVADWTPFAELSGVSLEVEIAAGSGKVAAGQAGAKRGARFVEDLLFTHRGLSGPAVLQASSYWRPGEALAIRLAPGADWPALLAQARSPRAAASATSWPSTCRSAWRRPGSRVSRCPPSGRCPRWVTRRCASSPNRSRNGA